MFKLGLVEWSNVHCAHSLTPQYRGVVLLPGPEHGVVVLQLLQLPLQLLLHGPAALQLSLQPAPLRGLGRRLAAGGVQGGRHHGLLPSLVTQGLGEWGRVVS